MGYRGYVQEFQEEDEEATEREIQVAENEMYVSGKMRNALKAALGGGDIKQIDIKQYAGAVRQANDMVEDGQAPWLRVSNAGSEDELASFMEPIWSSGNFDKDQENRFVAHVVNDPWTVLGYVHLCVKRQKRD